MYLYICIIYIKKNKIFQINDNVQFNKNNNNNNNKNSIYNS